jgi:branched-chain amino acid transport system substrate-binding protein
MRIKTLLNKEGITRLQAIIIAIIVVVAAVAGVVFYMLSRPPVRDYYKIGVIAELTGDLARGGFCVKRGYDMWANTINEKGGITIEGKSYRVELVYYDAKSDPAEAAKAVEKAVADGCDFLLGPYSSKCTLGGGPVAEKYKIPFVTGSAESHLIPEQHYKCTFQTCVTTRETPETIIKCLVQQYKLPIKTVAIIGADDAFSKSLAESFSDYCKKYGLNVIFFEIYPVAITDLTPVITRVMALNPDVLINAGHPSNHVVVIRNSKELKFNPKLFVFHWGVDTADFLDQLKADANYAVGAVMWSPKSPWKDPLFGSSKEFVDKFVTIYGREPDYSEAACAATGVFIGELLKKYKLTPPFDDAKRAKMLEALEEFSCETLFGVMKYSTDPAHWHVNIGLVEYLLTVQIINQKPVIIGPEKSKEANIVFPKPPW